ncbi:39S ribosomal protein L16, mitochondrial [Frankliniella occidentalis]|uniref:Large ribosomal subunit protein uL16m n=1 Tax=Frankliniella occidentalis TaxID=133901 RepID=A0A6J1S9H9_FRAOC|nr:39S ribosomal protein L16, mitochondrial [Frankliniella occidentalis]
MNLRNMLPAVRSVFQTVHFQTSLLKHGWNSMSTSSVRLRKTNYLTAPDDYSDIVIPERPKLPMLLKVPMLGPGQRHIKMKKNLKFMRGPEEVHNALLHEQFGIMALTGGRLKHSHLEMLRMKIGKKMDTNRMFAVWRVDDPWQPITKRGVGKRHGGGKGAIDHYVTPVKAGRIIVEVGGKCSFDEVQPWLSKLADIMPFDAIAVDQKTLLAMKKLEELKEQRNCNPYTFKYLVMNRMCGSHNWLKNMDKLYFGKYE